MRTTPSPPVACFFFASFPLLHFSFLPFGSFPLLLAPFPLHRCSFSFLHCCTVALFARVLDSLLFFSVVPRILQWVHSETKATLVARYSWGPHLMTMTGFQGAICILFNSHQSRTVRDIAAGLG